ncbi:hypothetical protein Mmc1_0273 [Magnetococcus marinus MC-1]|uniref:Uncharacterized protein n=1 Tax=Magnetococcus marinus (strain ATCC BAA-1437 / JCM 17883 / MC-1) TaxID=156889 RepID=A0L4A7_MAGMM|nr:hypothetical protein [Magnetococcus marinus]ABK42800.1 hypothetical protein Mmc1_0273 [Magnetococcus marinus MC-1]
MKKATIIGLFIGIGISLLAQIAVAGPPMLFGADGRYLGTLSNNRYDPNSVSNPYGRYGSRYSPDSINNPFGRYGSRYSSESVNNPFASNPPKIFSPYGGLR